MPDNAIYYRLAYAATLLLYAGYAASLAWRRARLRRRGAGSLALTWRGAAPLTMAPGETKTFRRDDAR